MLLSHTQHHILLCPDAKHAHAPHRNMVYALLVQIIPSRNIQCVLTQLTDISRSIHQADCLVNIMLRCPQRQPQHLICHVVCQIQRRPDLVPRILRVGIRRKPSDGVACGK